MEKAYICGAEAKVNSRLFRLTEKACWNTKAAVETVLKNVYTEAIRPHLKNESTTFTHI